MDRTSGPESLNPENTNDPEAGMDWIMYCDMAGVDMAPLGDAVEESNRASELARLNSDVEEVPNKPELLYPIPWTPNPKSQRQRRARRRPTDPSSQTLVGLYTKTYAREMSRPTLGPKLGNGACAKQSPER